MLKITEDCVCKSAPLTCRVSVAACRSGMVLSRMWNLQIDSSYDGRLMEGFIVVFTCLT